MIPRLVCDTMVLFQWAAIRRERLHGVHAAALDGRLRLCVSTELLTEIRGLLARPAIRARASHLTDQRVGLFLDTILAAADFFADPPKVFTLPQHPKDDHAFNLAIAARADRIATWEERLVCSGWTNRVLPTGCVRTPSARNCASSHRPHSWRN